MPIGSSYHLQSCLISDSKPSGRSPQAAPHRQWTCRRQRCTRHPLLNKNSSLERTITATVYRTFSAWQRVTLFYSEQTRRQKLRIRFPHLSLKTCIIQTVKPRSTCGGDLVHGIATRALAAAFIAQSTWTDISVTDSYTTNREFFFSFGAIAPQWASASSSFTRIFWFLDHTQRLATVGRTPLDEWSARRRDLYLTTHNTHNRQISMPPVGFEPMISAGERP